MAAELSVRQQAILDYLGAFIAEHDYPPSIRDIQRACAISSSSVVSYNLDRLAEYGYVRRARDTARGYALAGEHAGRSAIQVPLLGGIAAGIPLPGVPELMAPEGYVSITEAQGGWRRGLYGLRVMGTSLLPALLADGDIVVLEPRDAADPGEPVAATIIDRMETCLARYYPEGARVRLNPLNATMPPSYEASANVMIQARWVTMVRMT